MTRPDWNGRARGCELLVEPGRRRRSPRRSPREFVLGARSFGITDSLTLFYSRNWPWPDRRCRLFCNPNSGHPGDARQHCHGRGSVAVRAQRV